MFRVIGGVVVYGFAAFGLIKFLRSIRFRKPVSDEAR